MSSNNRSHVVEDDVDSRHRDTLLDLLRSPVVELFETLQADHDV